jgi:hypothetical protein
MDNQRNIQLGHPELNLPAKMRDILARLPSGLGQAGHHVFSGAARRTFDVDSADPTVKDRAIKSRDDYEHQEERTFVYARGVFSTELLFVIEEHAKWATIREDPFSLIQLVKEVTYSPPDDEFGTRDAIRARLHEDKQRAGEPLTAYLARFKLDLRFLIDIECFLNPDFDENYAGFQSDFCKVLLKGVDKIRNGNFLIYAASPHDKPTVTSLLSMGARMAKDEIPSSTSTAASSAASSSDAAGGDNALKRLIQTGVEKGVETAMLSLRAGPGPARSRCCYSHALGTCSNKHCKWDHPAQPTADDIRNARSAKATYDARAPREDDGKGRNGNERNGNERNKRGRRV